LLDLGALECTIIENLLEYVESNNVILAPGSDNIIVPQHPKQEDASPTPNDKISITSGDEIVEW
jgi:hypothetical protein